MIGLNTTQIKEALARLGYKDVRTLASKALGVVVPKTKVDAVVPQLMTAFAKFQPKRISDREMRLGDQSIFAKNANMQRVARAFTMGRGNEFNLMQAINEYIDDYGKPIDLEFKQQGGRPLFVAKNIMRVVHVGAKNVFQRNKADLHLVSKDMRVYPLSIKDDNASFWESADTYWGEKARVFLKWVLDNFEAELIPNGDGGYSLKPTVAVAALPQEVRDVVFGADVYGRGAVVIKKFLPNSFTWDFQRDVLVITCSYVILNEGDVSGKHEVFFQIQNDRARNSKYLEKGLRTKAAMRGMLYGSKLFERSVRQKLGV
jgi:hypothetical protein